MMTTCTLRPLRRYAALLLAACALAATEEAQSNAARVPDALVWNEADEKVPLHAELKKGSKGAILLLPIYTRCPASCRILTQKLKEGTSHTDSRVTYRVVLVSFDPAETAQSLHSFRKREAIPAEWTLLRADASEIRQIFDYFAYPVMTEQGGFVHPNKLFLLDRELTWRWTLAGEEGNSVELQKRLRQIEAPGVLGWAAMNPAPLIFIGFGGLLASLSFFIGWLMRAR